MALLATSQEGAVQFALNASSGLELIWSANQQVLRNVSQDYLEAIRRSHDYLKAEIKATENEPANPCFHNTLQTILQKQGPSVSVQADCYAGNLSVTKVTDDNKIQCFNR